MESITIIYLILALLLSIGIAFFQYFYKEKKASKGTFFLGILKSLSLFLIGVLLINPKVKTTKTEDLKPVLAVLLDNSLSTTYFKEASFVTDFMNKVKSNEALNNKFDVSFFSFGKEVKVIDSLSFDETNTNISKGLQAIQQLYKKDLGATVLVSDGNQTIGNDYEYTAINKKVYPVVIGDTTQYSDIRITQLNVNKFSYLKNKFPVEVLLRYEGNTPVISTFKITKAGKVVFSKKIAFSPEKTTHTISTSLISSAEGVQYYKTSISPLSKEKNTRNNYKSFSVEVLNEQAKVLILTSVIHPDLGMLKKAIEKNKQRKVSISLINKFNGKLKDYQMLVFYQPNSYFKKYFKENISNFLLITGTKTDWNFINSLKLGFTKKVIHQTENFTADYNPNFLNFFQKDIGFGSLPPLTGKFGQLNLTYDCQVMMYQKISGIKTKQPLVATFNLKDKRFSTIFGEGIWKWRASAFREQQSFEDFDGFINNIVQYTSSTKRRNRLDVDAKRIYPANSSISITAMYLDNNYKFDNRASLDIKITNKATKKQITLPFSLTNNSFQVDIEGLIPGSYSYVVNVKGQEIKSGGRFKITNYQIEEQFVCSNPTKLNKLANKTGGKLYFKNKEATLFQDLIANESYYTTQKSTVTQESLISWKWLLFIIVVLLAVEWFYRKYIGKI